MRGKAVSNWIKGTNSRITPAHAGKRHWIWQVDNEFEDHPRPCGEKMWRAHSEYGERGSPPPMRGKAPVLKVVGG